MRVSESHHVIGAESGLFTSTASWGSSERWVGFMPAKPPKGGLAQKLAIGRRASSVATVPLFWSTKVRTAVSLCLLLTILHKALVPSTRVWSKQSVSVTKTQDGAGRQIIDSHRLDMVVSPVAKARRAGVHVGACSNSYVNGNIGSGVHIRLWRFYISPRKGSIQDSLYQF